jgi:multidrug efflux system membrane fusion protein
MLAQLDPQDYKLAAQAAKAQVAAALTNRDLAAADFKRYKELRDQNFISGAELERREASTEGGTGPVGPGQAQGSGQGNQAAYTTLVADVSGVITAVEARSGRWWPPERRWCALPRTDRAMWCLRYPRTRFP